MKKEFVSFGDETVVLQPEEVQALEMTYGKKAESKKSSIFSISRLISIFGKKAETNVEKDRNPSVLLFHQDIFQIINLKITLVNATIQLKNRNQDFTKSHVLKYIDELKVKINDIEKRYKLIKNYLNKISGKDHSERLLAAINTLVTLSREAIEEAEESTNFIF